MIIRSSPHTGETRDITVRSRTRIWASALAIIGLLAVSVVAVAWSQRPQPQLGFGPILIEQFVTFPKRDQSFGDIPFCNQSPATTKIVITGITLNEPTPNLTAPAWGWKDTFKNGEPFFILSDEPLKKMGYLPKPVEVKEDCKTAWLPTAPISKDVSPEFAIQLHAAGLTDEYSNGGLTVSYEQNGQSMTTILPYLYIFCGSGSSHDPKVSSQCTR